MAQPSDKPSLPRRVCVPLLSACVVDKLHSSPLCRNLRLILGHCLHRVRIGWASPRWLTHHCLVACPRCAVPLSICRQCCHRRPPPQPPPQIPVPFAGGKFGVTGASGQHGVQRSKHIGSHISRHTCAGIREGGRTGVTGLTLCCLFFITLFFNPIFGAYSAILGGMSLTWTPHLLASACLTMQFPPAGRPLHQPASMHVHRLTATSPVSPRSSANCNSTAVLNISVAIPQRPFRLTP